MKMSKTLIGAAALFFAGTAYAQSAPAAPAAEAKDAKAACADCAGGCEGCCGGCQGGIDLNLGAAKAKLFLGASYRFRGEVRSPFSYAAGARNDDTANAFRSRLRLTGNVMLPEDMGLMMTLQDVRNFGDEANGGANVPLNSGSTGLDFLTLAFTKRNIADSGFDMVLGRQQFELGGGRIWSTDEFSAASRSWDGVRFVNENLGGGAEASLFGLVVNDGVRAGDTEYAAGGSIGIEVNDKLQLEATYIWQLRQVAGALPEGQRNTWSLRAEGTCEYTDINYSAEAVFQHGTEGPQDFDLFAFAFAGALNYRTPIKMGGEEVAGLVFKAGYDYATGDSNATNNEVRTFRAPFPASHEANGHADVLGWSNIHDYSVGIVWDSVDEWSISVDAHLFRRANSADGAYGPNGGLLRAGFPGMSRNLGAELDFTYATELNDWMWLEFSWNHFFAGPFFEDSRNGIAGDGGNGSQDTDYIWLACGAKF